jgi:predicted lipoprotein with Yx(FWY)xxD motif
MFRTKIFAPAFVASVCVHAWTDAAAGSMPPVKTEGGMLVGTSGMTLYTFDKDAAGAGKSACNGPCAENWQPLQAGVDDRGEGNYSIVTREDGSKQWAHKGKPLYFWVKDAKPGDTSGDGVKGVWHTARP